MRKGGDKIAVIVTEAEEGRESNALFWLGPLFDLVEFGGVWVDAVIRDDAA